MHGKFLYLFNYFNINFNYVFKEGILMGTEHMKLMT
jgi:hypothetical protein